MNNIKKFFVDFFSNILEKILAKILKDLTWIYLQLSKGGVNSVFYLYLYNDKNKLYIKRFEEVGIEYSTTDRLDENTMPIDAQDFANVWERNIILWLINWGKSAENKFRWKRFLDLSGGNFGANATNIDISNQS